MPMRWLCLWLLLLGSARAADIAADCQRIADRSLRMLSQRDYDEYLKCFDPDSAGYEVIQANIKTRRELDPSLTKSENSFSEFALAGGSDPYYIYAHAVQRTTLVVVETSGTHTVVQQQYVLILFNKDTRLISWMFPVRLMSRNITP